MEAHNRANRERAGREIRRSHPMELEPNADQGLDKPGKQYSYVWPVVNSKFNIFLFALPLALTAWARDMSPALIFVTCLIALCPCAERLGFITEQLAAHTNDTVGGLLNATFGNITEIVFSLFAIKAGLLRVVQLSLLGSVISNLLLVLGSAFIVGGFTASVQNVNPHGSSVNNTLLMLSVMAVLLPSTLQFTRTEVVDGDELQLSRFESVTLLLVYAGLLIFQLKTHRKFLEREVDPEPEPETICASDSLTFDIDTACTWDVRSNQYFDDGHQATPMDTIPQESTLVYAAGSQYPPASADRIILRAVTDPETHATVIMPTETAKQLSLTACIIWLTVIASVIGLLSEALVSVIEEASDRLHISLPFLSTIILPIVGNAAEHASALIFASKSRMELVMGVAVGSATQIAVFVMPLCVLVAWAMDQPLDLNLDTFETVVFCGSIFMVVTTMQHASSNWLKGTTLVTAYLFICAAFWLHRDPQL